MSLTKEDQKKISKIGTSALTVRVQLGKFEGEELEYAISLLKKRHVDIDSILAKKAAKIVEEVITPEIDAQLRKDFPANIEGSPEFFAACEVESIIIDVIDEIPTPEKLEEVEKMITKPIKEKKAKVAKKSGKHEKKLYTDENGKEMTKSDLMRRLIRLKHSIKPKELNDQLIAAGFEKAYHSEIQRCRQQMGVTPEVKE